MCFGMLGTLVSVLASGLLFLKVTAFKDALLIDWSNKAVSCGVVTSAVILVCSACIFYGAFTIYKTKAL